MSTSVVLYKEHGTPSLWQCSTVQRSHQAHCNPDNSSSGSAVCALRPHLEPSRLQNQQREPLERASCLLSLLLPPSLLPSLILLLSSPSLLLLSSFSSFPSSPSSPSLFLLSLLSLFLLFFETRSHIPKASLSCSMYPKLPLNLS